MAEEDPSVQGHEPISQEKLHNPQDTNAKRIDHWNLIFTQVSKGGGYSKVDISKVNFEGKHSQNPRGPRGRPHLKAVAEPTARIRPQFSPCACAAFTVYSNIASSGLTPVNPMCISSPPTGPMIYAVNKNFAEDYITMNPEGINVPLSHQRRR
eukprot:scaffold21714_cov133-Isochrysis_galbana.AAC.2